MDNASRNHWNKIFSAKKAGEVSWFQSYPGISMDFIEWFQLPVESNIIDIGGGDSHLVDVLLENGYRNIWVLDISEKAIDRAKERLGEKAEKIHWVICDVVDFEPPVSFDLWHDRAAFHFLIEKDKIKKYVSIAGNSVRQNGHLILGTFSEQGPDKCSGLETKQYSEVSMSRQFKNTFDKIRCIHEDHITPFHTTQNFLFCSFRKR